MRNPYLKFVTDIQQGAESATLYRLSRWENTTHRQCLNTGKMPATSDNLEEIF